MSLRPVSDVVRQATDAAASILFAARNTRDAATLSVEQITSFVNQLQSSFARIKPIMAFQATEVQNAATALYGSRTPADVMTMIGAGQLAGQAVIEAIVTSVVTPTTASQLFDPVSNTYLQRNLAGADLVPMHAPLDALIAVLSPLDTGL